MEREKFKSRLGFIFLSAGCAIGIGNVWRFPYIVGKNGGGLFVLIYVFFLIALGLPIMTMEFAVGRASRKSAIKAYQELEKPGQKWHWHGPVAMAGNYLLMMFYTTVAGWMLHYFYLTIKGDFVEKDAQQVGAIFGEMLSQPGTMTFWTVIVIIVGFLICSFGLQRGVERITKWIMTALLVIMLVLAINSFTMKGAAEGLRFYLVPSLERAREVGFGTVIVEAMNQAFFTLSLGIGALAIFGSYMEKDRTLLGESVNIAVLDTFVAFVAGLIIFPACFSYGVEPAQGPSLIFITLPNIFNHMPLGRLWGSLFFLFMSFAAFTTVLAVFENIMSFAMDLWGWDRKKAAIVNVIAIIILSMPCILGYNVWSDFHPLREGNQILDLEDFLVSNLLLPFGSLIYLLFCTSKYGWGWKNFQKEANTGKGMKIPNWLRGYVSYVLPVVVTIILVYGLVTYF